MNERIQELWDKAAELKTDPSWEGQTKFMEKFAELIVRECIQIANQSNVTGESIIGERIKQHFGVK